MLLVQNARRQGEATMQSLTSRVFDDRDTDPVDPYAFFEEWYQAAQANESQDPNAMTLATVDEDGLPDARMVLMNGRSPEGIAFFGNAESAKGVQLAANPRAALLFHWKSLFRQVRVRGPVEQIGADDVAAFFATRPRGARISAHASEQSRPLESREVLHARVAKLEADFQSGDLPRPPHWMGYRLKPMIWEFWQAGEFRLHDRFVFTRSGQDWVCQRLQP